MTKRKTTRKTSQPPHPGALLHRELMQPLDIGVTELARALGITAARLRAVVEGRRGVDAELALRLGRYFGTVAEVWTGLQTHHDLAVARRAIGAQVRREVKPHQR